MGFGGDDYGGRGKTYDFDDYDDEDERRSEGSDEDGEDEHSDEKDEKKDKDIRIVMMSPFRPLAKRDRLRKNGELRFAGDGKPLQNNLRAGQQVFFLWQFLFSLLKNIHSKLILQIHA